MNRYYSGVNPYFLRPPQYMVGGGADGDITVYRGLRRQHGSGLITNVLSALFRRFAPVVKDIGKNIVAPHAKQALKSVLSDAMAGENIKKSIKKRGVGALKDMGQSFVDSQKGSGRGQGKRSGQKKTATKRRAGQKSVAIRRVLNPKKSIFDP